LHDLELAAHYCDYLYVVKKGKVAAFGTPEEILTRQLISDIYEVECEIYKNPVTGGLGIAYLT
jgi:iron complex transport system ATP-binding protein